MLQQPSRGGLVDIVGQGQRRRSRHHHLSIQFEISDFLQDKIDIVDTLRLIDKNHVVTIQKCFQFG